jgi:hypothetical protein
MIKEIFIHKKKAACLEMFGASRFGYDILIRL